MKLNNIQAKEGERRNRKRLGCSGPARSSRSADWPKGSWPARRRCW